jgi:hypothetical protein
LSSAGLRENIWHQEVQDAVRGFLSAQDRITQAAMEYVADKITLEEFRNRSYIIPNDGINPLIKR